MTSFNSYTLKSQTKAFKHLHPTILRIQERQNLFKLDHLSLEIVSLAKIIHLTCNLSILQIVLKEFKWPRLQLL